jgi:dTDP-4-dehydrorhamnose reductase
MQALELWGGPECTVNRVGGRLRDQLRESGHHDRIEDLDQFARLGITAIRYPLLWERIAPDRPDTFDWTWSDSRLARLRQLNIRPIAGLVHHGSGPLYTDLLADNFATGLASFARAVAHRYPWIEAWTPVNEPVTTARFSALYGLWHPHLRDEASFWRVLLNQIDGVRLAMSEIRRVNPAAKLIQTDDLGRTYATAAVREQAAFDNVRRWMSWDLLYGRVVPSHPLWRRLCGFGLEERLRRIADAPCPPDVIGVNHYLTSDRFLDHRVQRYPAHLCGGNADRRFADTEAVRVLDPPPPGLRGVLQEAWRRYGLPLAITEVHNGCTRDEQMRWMAEAWFTALHLRQEGVDLRAVTAWSLLGSSGWNSLLTDTGCYETGVYDARGGAPRPTAMVGLLQTLASGASLHPACRPQGWWRRPIRLHHPAVPRPAPMRDFPVPADRSRSATDRILIVGADDARTGHITGACMHRGLPFRIMAPHQISHTMVTDGCWAALLLDPAPHIRSAMLETGLFFIEADLDEDADMLLDRLIDSHMHVFCPAPAD